MSPPIRNREFAQPAAESPRGGEADYSHLRIQGWSGIRNPADGRIAPAANAETAYGWDEKTSLALPVTVALGTVGQVVNLAPFRRLGNPPHECAIEAASHAAMGAALAGVSVSCGPDVWRSAGEMPVAPALGRVVGAFDRYHRGHGELLLQVGEEDVRWGVPEHLIRKHRLRSIELTLGRDAGDNGDALRIDSLEQALACQRQGYTVVPDPSDPIVQECFADGLIQSFERHARLTVFDEAGFLETCQRLRGLGFQRIALRTGAAGLRELAMILKWSSRARIDLVTLEGRFGERTGIGAEPRSLSTFLPHSGAEPVPIFLPDLQLHAAAAEFAARLAAKGERVSDLAFAGGFHYAEQIFKALALGSPFVKAVQADDIVAGVPAFDRFGRQIEQVFGCWEEVAELVGKREMANVPMAAVGVYARVQRLADDLRPIMAAARCFISAGIGRQQLVSLTRQCAEATGIPLAAEAHRAAAEAILDR